MACRLLNVGSRLRGQAPDARARTPARQQTIPVDGTSPRLCHGHAGTPLIGPAVVDADPRPWSRDTRGGGGIAAVSGAGGDCACHPPVGAVTHSFEHFRS